MRTRRLIERMEAFPNMVSCAVAALTPEEARWKPPDPRYPAGSWSVPEPSSGNVTAVAPLSA